MNWGFAGSISVLMLVVVLAVFALYDKLLGLSTHDGRIGARPRSTAPAPGRCTAWATRSWAASARSSDRLIALVPRRRGGADPSSSLPLRLVVLLVLLFLSVPALLMIPLSFGRSGLNWPPSGFTLQHYQNLAASPLWMSAAAALARHRLRRRDPGDADRHAGRLPARAPADARQVVRCSPSCSRRSSSRA